MILLNEKLVLKALHKKFNNQIPSLFSEIAYKGKDAFLFFVFIDKSDKLSKKTSYNIIENDNSIDFILHKNNKTYKLNVEKIYNFKSYFYVEMNELGEINEIVEFIF
jgi:protease II